MPDPEPSSPREPRFPWRVVFHRTAAPVFVVGPTRRLRYANPAWEVLTGRPFAKLRGMRISTRRSAALLGQTLAPPPEVWAGQPATVRRPVPDADAGPPWWDLSFVPLPGPKDRPLAVLGVIAVVGNDAPRGEVRSVSAGVGELRRRHAAQFPFDLFAGASPRAEQLLAQARLAAATTVPVFLVGEPGTGKETFARVIHHNGSQRERAFVALDCVGVQPYLAEGLLFGKGGLLDGGQVGTLYLKDPAALPRDLQQRLTKSEGGPRLICGSHRPAADDVAAGRLIASFHAELSVLEIRLPPLRERLDDLSRFAERHPLPAISEDVWPALRAHDWPGNLRELAAILGQAAREAGTGPLTKEHLPRYIREKHLIASALVPATEKPWTLDGVLEAVERRLIEQALRKAGGSQTDAAAALGVPRARLWRRMEALNIPK